MSVRTISPVRVNPVLSHPSERRLDLAGQWSFRLDPDDQGIKQGWAADPSALDEEITVPGCWQGQGFGGDGKDMVQDFRLEARTYRATYKGTGWYGRSFDVPAEWRGQRIWLNFGGVHPSAEVWVNGVRIGQTNAPFVPFGFEITELVKFDENNSMVVRVHEENRWMGSSFNWQGNWSGLYRTVELRATGQGFIEQMWICPDVDGRKLRIRGRIGGTDGGTAIQVCASPIGEDSPAATTEQPVEAESFEFDLPVPTPKLWSPDAPNLYRVDVRLIVSGKVSDAMTERVGFVKLSTEGKHFLINDEPYYIRGTGDFISNPETGSPDTDRDRWRKKLRTLRDYGYNQVRCQSYVPAPEYLDVADEVGLIIQSEMGMLGNWGGLSPWHVYPWPPPSPLYRDRLKWQWDRVVMRDVNHPSANIYCMSNELPRCMYPRTAWQCYHDTKAVKPTCMVIWTDGGHCDDLPEDFANAEAKFDAECDKPLIRHEWRWWSSYPDVAIMDKYDGAMRPYAAEIAMEAAKQHGIAHVLPLAAEMSQKLQLLESKGQMELCRRDNERLAGISHFNAMDVSPSPQGVIDEFYEHKLADAQSWLQTNGDTVVMASLDFEARVFTGGETLRCSLSVSDFSHPPLKAPAIEWRLLAGESEIAAGKIDYAHKPFCTCPAGELEAAIGEISKPAKARLEAKLFEGDRAFTNQWDMWLLPGEVALPESLALYGDREHTWLKTLESVPTASSDELGEGSRFRVVLTERLDEMLVDFARSGGRVILAAGEGLVRPFDPKLGGLLGHYFFTPPAQYPPYEDGHDGTIIAEHPIFGDLPHEGFADLQFFRLIADAPSLELEPLGLNDADPIIRVMHSYPLCRSLGYLLERSLGKGGLILCALNLDQSFAEGRYLLAQMCEYAASDDFSAATTLSEDTLARIVTETSLP